MNTHSKDTLDVNENRNGKLIELRFGDSNINLGRSCRSDTCVQRELQSRASCLQRKFANLKSESNEHRIESVFQMEQILNSEKNEESLYILIYELEKELATLKQENSQLETKLKETEAILANAKAKLEMGHSSQELIVVTDHLKDQLSQMKEKKHSYEGDVMFQRSELQRSLSISNNERVKLQELLDIMKSIIEPEQYDLIMNMYRQQFDKNMKIKHKKISREQEASEFPYEEQGNRRKRSSLNKRSKKSSKEESPISNEATRTKEPKTVKKRKRKEKMCKILSELHISMAENDCLKSELKTKNEQILKLVKDVEYVSTAARRRIEELRKDIEGLIRKGGQNEALWARCLELKEAKESIEKQFILYKQARYDDSITLEGVTDNGGVIGECNDKEENRQRLNAVMNQINQLKLENDRLRNENRNLTLQCQHFQRLALYSQPNIAFEETRFTRQTYPLEQHKQ